jgi:hypothetical protein
MIFQAHRRHLLATVKDTSCVIFVVYIKMWQFYCGGPWTVTGQPIGRPGGADPRAYLVTKLFMASELIEATTATHHPGPQPPRDATRRRQRAGVHRCRRQQHQHAAGSPRRRPPRDAKPQLRGGCGWGRSRIRAPGRAWPSASKSCMIRWLMALGWWWCTAAPPEPPKAKFHRPMASVRTMA